MYLVPVYSVGLLSVHFIDSHTDLLNLDSVLLVSLRAGTICRARIQTQVPWSLQSLWAPLGYL